MSQPQTQRLETSRGAVELLCQVRAERLKGLEMDGGIGVFSRYRSILTSKDSLARQASDARANLCLALYQKRRIMGYCIRRPPPPDERWAHLDPPVLQELFGENARGWRDQGLMKPMLKMVVEEEANQDRILYIVAYSWHWDLDETKKTLGQYRDTIINLLSPLGFQQYPTNEPNVCLRPENLFMARIGKRVDKKTKKKFTNLLFGIFEEE